MIETQLVAEIGASPADFSGFSDETFDVEETIKNQNALEDPDLQEEDDDIEDPINNEDPPNPPNPNEDISEEEEEEEEEGESPKKDPPSTLEEEDDEDASDAALLAKVYKQEGVLPEDLEIKSDMTMLEFKDLVLETWKKEVDIDKIAEQKGFTPELRKIAEELHAGVSYETMQESIQIEKLKDLEVKGNEEDKVELRKELILQMYKLEGIADKRAERLYEAIVDSGEDEEEAEKAIEVIVNKDKERREAEKNEKKEQERLQAEAQKRREKEIQKILDKGELVGEKLTKAEVARLKEAMEKPTETVEINGEKMKATKIQAKMLEYRENVEWQLKFMKMLLDDFSFEKTEKKIRPNVEYDILDKMGARVTKRSKPNIKARPVYVTK